MRLIPLLARTTLVTGDRAAAPGLIGPAPAGPN